MCDDIMRTSASYFQPSPFLSNHGEQNQRYNKDLTRIDLVGFHQIIGNDKRRFHLKFLQKSAEPTRYFYLSRLLIFNLDRQQMATMFKNKIYFIPIRTAPKLNLAKAIELILDKASQLAVNKIFSDFSFFFFQLCERIGGRQIISQSDIIKKSLGSFFNRRNLVG